MRTKQRQKETAKVVLLPIDDIAPCPYQTRTVFDDKEIRRLAVSILQNGLLQPISVRQGDDKKYQLVAGERRLRACKLCGMDEIPAIIYQFEDEQTAALSLLENWQREQLNPFEQARALQDILRLWNCTQEQAAARLGISQPTLANKLRLLCLSEEQAEICVRGGLTERHARAVLKLEQEEQRTKALQAAVNKQLTVQQMEAYVDGMASPEKKPHRAVMIKDVRIFVNTINRAIKTMTAGGIAATAEKREEKGFIEYVVRIPTAAAKKE